MDRTLKNEQEIINAGKVFASQLKGGDVVLLHGDLGAGKTTFTKGIARGLGIKDTITSPTFTLMNVYEGGKLVHIDTYRLESPHELIAIGAADYVGQPETISIIEWPEKIQDLLGDKKTVSVFLKHTSAGRELSTEA